MSVSWPVILTCGAGDRRHLNEFRLSHVCPPTARPSADCAGHNRTHADFMGRDPVSTPPNTTSLLGFRGEKARSKSARRRTGPRELALTPLLLVGITLKAWEAIVRTPVDRAAQTWHTRSRHEHPQATPPRYR